MAVSNRTYDCSLRPQDSKETQNCPEHSYKQNDDISMEVFFFFAERARSIVGQLLET